MNFWSLFEFSLPALVLFLLVCGLLLLTGALQKRRPRLRHITNRLLISYLTIILMLTGGEFYFRYSYADSGLLWTRAGENWMEKYVHFNALGYRDVEWNPERLTGKKTVLVFGDSLTMGLGIENPEDRYSNVLGKLLGSEWVVLNAGVANTATRAQYDIVSNYPLKNPDVVIWQYFLNDINDAGLSIGDHWWPRLPLHQPAWIRDSYLANFLYWRVAPLLTVVDVTENDLTYWDWAFNAYDNYVIWDIHKQEINRLLAYLQATGARIIVIIFPNPLEPVASIPYVDRVAQHFETQGVTEMLRLYEDIAFFAENEGATAVVVSPRDAHPSAAFNHYLGQRIYNVFFAPG
jgi:hypothetical protein